MSDRFERLHDRWLKSETLSNSRLFQKDQARGRAYFVDHEAQAQYVSRTIERRAFKFLHGGISAVRAGLARGIPDDGPALARIRVLPRQMLRAECRLIVARPLARLVRFHLCHMGMRPPSFKIINKNRYAYDFAQSY
jgi:hypothetical protein